jgi:FkbM family methyltransferase
LKKIKNNYYIKKIFKSSAGKFLKDAFIVRAIEHPAGDWRYPFLLFSWWLVKKLVPRRKVKVNGVTFSLSCTNWITHFRWFLFKTKEPEVRYFIDEYIDDGDIFFDIGANVGVFSIYAAKRYKKIEVYSFEPEVSNLATLKENIIENNVTEKVIIHGIGISNSVGLSKLHLQDLTTGSALHTEDRKNIDHSYEGNNPIIWAEGIYTVTLDYFCEELNIVPNAIKIDTDGNESKILMGAENLLKSPLLKAIIIEMPEDQTEYCYSMLLGSGFIKKDYPFKESRNEIWIKG